MTTQRQQSVDEQSALITSLLQSAAQGFPQDQLIAASYLLDQALRIINGMPEHLVSKSMLHHTTRLSMEITGSLRLLAASESDHIAEAADPFTEHVIQAGPYFIRRAKKLQTSGYFVAEQLVSLFETQAYTPYRTTHDVVLATHKIVRLYLRVQQLQRTTANTVTLTGVILGCYAGLDRIVSQGVHNTAYHWLNTLRKDQRVLVICSEQNCGNGAWESSYIYPLNDE